MNEIDRLRQYGRQLDAATPPDVDVRARVLRTIARPQAEQWGDAWRPLAAAAAASWATVFITGYFVQECWSQLQDPLTSLLAPFVVSLQ